MCQRPGHDLMSQWSQEDVQKPLRLTCSEVRGAGTPPHAPSSLPGRLSLVPPLLEGCWEVSAPCASSQSVGSGLERH